MAVKGLLVVQGGKQTIIPDTPTNRKFWEDYNATIGKSKVAHKRYVTLIEADQATVETSLAPKIVRKTAQTPDIRKENEDLRKELSEMKSMMLRLMAQNVTPVPMAQAADDEKFEKF